jgi:STE24 endopeptidase
MLTRLFALWILFLTLGTAQDKPPVLQVPPAAQAGPGFSAEAATNAYLASLPADKKAKSDAYFEGGYWLILWNFLYSAAISLLLLFSRLSARMRDMAERLTKVRPLQIYVYWAI